MKIKEIKAMSKEERDNKLEELKKELMRTNAQIATGTTPKSPGNVKQIKKTIAKISMIKKQEVKKKDE